MSSQENVEKCRAPESAEGVVDGHNLDGERLVLVHNPGGCCHRERIPIYPNLDFVDGECIRFSIMPVGVEPKRMLKAIGPYSIDHLATD